MTWTQHSIGNFTTFTIVASDGIFEFARASCVADAKG